MIAARSSACRLQRSGTRPPRAVSACQVQPFPSCEAVRFLRFRLVALGTMASADHRTALCGASLSVPSTLLKSCRDAMIIAQSKRGTSAALGYGRNINPSPFAWFAAPGRSGAANQAKGEAGYQGVAFYSGRRPRRPCPGLLSRCPSGAPNFDRWLPAHETSRFRSCFGLVFGPSCPSL
jgi:hypothetical protein